jgi:predicted TIM-barrel fold metal-dependent hydrolase
MTTIATRAEVGPARGTASKLAIADCDIHPTTKSIEDLAPFLEKRWRDLLRDFGHSPRVGFQNGPAYPKGQPDAARRDAYPDAGGKPGSDLSFMQAQLLDAHNVQLGILNPISPYAGAGMNPDMAIAFCTAVNDWQIAAWTSQDARLRASITVPYENAAAAAAEIDRRAGDPNFAQVLLLSRTAEPLGQRRYWPIFEAAVRAGLPVAIHAFGYGGYPVTSAGWPSYYIEEMVGHAQSAQGLLASLVIEGVFERFPGLRVIIVEAGFAWLPALAWRMDKAWEKLRVEVPHVPRPPSEYLRESVWFTTQPMEEPRTGGDLLDAIGWIGWDRLLFASDYPHWDFDDPTRAVPVQLPRSRERQLFLGNAKAVYGIA